MRLLAVLAVACAVVVSACGKSDEDKAGEVTRAYLTALGNKEYAKGCDQLAASAKRDLVEYVSVQVPELGTTECESVFKQLIELTDETALAAVRDAKVRKVTVTGDTAEVEVEGATQTAKLRKVDGEWRISELEFEDAAAAVPPGEEAAPADEETPEPDAGGPEEVALLQGRLEGAGYSVQETDVGSGEPVPEGALEVELGGGAGMTVYVYSSLTDAAQAEVDFDPVVDENPDQIAVRTEGTHVYVGTIEEPAKLPKGKFNKAVDAAEGN